MASEVGRVIVATLRGLAFVALTLVGALAGAGVVVLKAIEDLASKAAKGIR